MSEIRCCNCGARFEQDATEFCPAPGCGFPVAFMTLDEGQGPEDGEFGDILRRPDEDASAPEIANPPLSRSSTSPPPDPPSPPPGMVEVPVSGSEASPSGVSPAVHPGIPRNHGGTPWLDTEEFGSRNRRLIGLIALVGLAVVAFALTELFGMSEAWAPIRELVMVPSIGHAAVIPTALATPIDENAAPRRTR